MFTHETMKLEQLPLGTRVCGHGTYKLVRRELSHTTKGGTRMFDCTWESTVDEPGQPKGHTFTRKARGDRNELIYTEDNS